MSEFNFVSAENLKTLEQYASSLLVSVSSLKTLEAYEINAFKEGLFDDEEEETSKTIVWEIKRLILLYKNQLVKIIERTGFKEEDAINEFKKLMPDTKIPKRRKLRSAKKT